MSEAVTAEVTPPETDSTQQHKFEDLPADHPLVKRLEALKVENKDLKPKAQRLAQIEEAAKSKEEKDAERIATAEAEVATIPAKVTEALKSHLVELHKFDPEDVELFLTATDPELLLKQVTRLLDTRTGTRKKHVVAREGENHNAESHSDMRDFTRQLFGRDG